MEDFKDAVEGNFTTEQTDTAQHAGTERAAGSGGNGVDSDAADTRSGQAAAAETSVSQPPSIVEERPPPATGRAESIIATGLANVRLPMGYVRRCGEEPVDSDDEDQFHDAFDSGPGMVKDAAKAREMKETGNE